MSTLKANSLSEHVPRCCTCSIPGCYHSGNIAKTRQIQLDRRCWLVWLIVSSHDMRFHSLLWQDVHVLLGQDGILDVPRHLRDWIRCLWCCSFINGAHHWACRCGRWICWHLHRSHAHHRVCGTLGEASDVYRNHWSSVRRRVGRWTLIGRVSKTQYGRRRAYLEAFLPSSLSQMYADHTSLSASSPTSSHGGGASISTCRLEPSRSYSSSSTTRTRRPHRLYQRAGRRSSINWTCLAR